MFDYNMDMLYGRFSSDEPQVCSPLPKTNDLVNRQFPSEGICRSVHKSIPENVLDRIDTWAMGKPLYEPRESYDFYINLVNSHLENHANSNYNEDHLAAACFYLMCIMYYQNKESSEVEVCAMKDEPVQLSMDFH